MVTTSRAPLIGVTLGGAVLAAVTVANWNRDAGLVSPLIVLGLMVVGGLGFMALAWSHAAALSRTDTVAAWMAAGMWLAVGALLMLRLELFATPLQGNWPGKLVGGALLMFGLWAAWRAARTRPAASA